MKSWPDRLRDLSLDKLELLIVQQVRQIDIAKRDLETLQDVAREKMPEAEPARECVTLTLARYERLPQRVRNGKPEQIRWFRCSECGAICENPRNPCHYCKRPTITTGELSEWPNKDGGAEPVRECGDKLTLAESCFHEAQAGIMRREIIHGERLPDGTRIKDRT